MLVVAAVELDFSLLALVEMERLVAVEDIPNTMEHLLVLLV
jgi:hypothetical protein